ncbi:sensor histidine kinase [Crassaminicella thermophila]|nr:ATP-binding protein [Crassaminicella thermophila]
MFQTNYLLIILTILTLAISLFYFHIFTKNHEKYIHFWGLSWTLYAISLGFSIFILKYPSVKFFAALRQVCDLFSSLFLLAGTYVFIDKKMPNYWIQFTIVNLLWIGLAVYYDLSFITITLLASIFFNIIAVVTGVMLLKYWKMNKFEKVIIVTIFLVWGVHKAYYPYIYPEFWNSPLGYMSEIILANILNFGILIIYFQKIRNELTESEKRFRLLAENAQDLIYLYRFRPILGFEYVSPSCINITGYTPEEFYRDPMFLKKLAHPDDRPLVNILKESKTLLSEPITMRWLHKNGHYIWTEHHNTVIVDEVGDVIAVEGILRDITDRKRVEENMIQSEKSRQSLLANISHELRTPITSILGYVTAMIDGTIYENDSKEECLNLIRSKAVTLQRLIQDLFQLTQLESGKISFNFSQVSIRELVFELVKKYEWDIHREGIKFELILSNIEKYMDEELIIDIERIDQVLSNLIFNAIKHTPKEGTIFIDFEKKKKNDIKYVLIKIKDTGEGIAQKDLKHIFDRFYRGKNAKNNVLKGTGLGLTISKEIVEFHKGEIWAESSLGEGCTFCFTLPIYSL